MWIMREERAFYTQEVTPDRAPDDPTTRNHAASLHVLVDPAVWSCRPSPVHQPTGPCGAQPPAGSRCVPRLLLTIAGTHTDLPGGPGALGLG